MGSIIGIHFGVAGGPEGHYWGNNVNRPNTPREKAVVGDYAKPHIAAFRKWLQLNYKGSVKPKELINFIVISYTDQFNRIVVGMEYIIFLKKTDWIIKSEKENNINSYTIADRWLGIQSYYEDLNNYLSKN